ncbi:MAG TPA: CHAD domain-containing protein, partial [Pusillimonas sp.]|uniref:CHAD domain-containing protein n=1 Tax=Pusillimonas sp. TaxID=3040095 RepID=UPI002C54A450
SNTDGDLSNAAMAGAGSVEFQTALLLLLQQLIDLGDAESHKQQSGKRKKGKSQKAKQQQELAPALRSRLEKWWKKILKKGHDFDELSDEEQHSVRKQVKLARYGLELVAGVISKSSRAELGAALEDIQKILGDLNDYYIAEAHYRAKDGTAEGKQPATWFAIGWLRAMQVRQVELAQTFFQGQRCAARVKHKKN